ncbi:MAG: SDR family NAD(P)-dependent oxidoreductase [Chlamydiales bacterium]|nr:SDR family NAD(P)-dependent oxidoreductase [Chlamydiales bacterium]
MKGKTAFISGASSGIGKACAERFALLGVNLVIAARRMDRLVILAEELTKHGVQVTPIQLDVQDHAQVEAAFNLLQEKNISVDILVNNAGLALSMDKMQCAQLSNWETMIDTNIKGLLYVTRAFLPGMVKRNCGHIINIGSIAGHECYISGNVYCACKHAVRAISKSLRLDLLETAIRVSEVDPGAVETEFSEVRLQDKKSAKKCYEGFKPLVADDIADAVLYCATRPEHVNIAEIIVYPQAQASITNINRKIS